MNPKLLHFFGTWWVLQAIIWMFSKPSNNIIDIGWFTALVLSVKKIESTLHNYNSWFLTGLYPNSTTLHKVQNKCSTWAFHVVNLHFKCGTFLNPTCKMQVHIK